MADSDDNVLKHGCGCFGAVAALCVVAGVWGSIDGCIDDAKNSRIEAKYRAEIARTNELKKAQISAKEDKLRSFALAESPELWRISQRLKGEIQLQAERIAKLRDAFVEFGKDPEQDADYRSICTMRDEMIESLTKINEKLEEAYLASKKFEATPSRSEYDSLRQKALQDGIHEAEIATKRFDEMRLSK